LFFGSRHSDPHNLAAHGAKRVIIDDDLYNLSASQPYIYTHPESRRGGIDYQAGKPLFMLIVALYDKAARLL
jgi:hypothetical protein